MEKDTLALRYVDKLPRLEELAPGSRCSFALNVSRMADGTSLYLPVNVLVGASTRPRLVLVAGVHGVEYEGILAASALWHELDPGELKGTVVIVPVANPPAFRALVRRNPADDVDMNRIFPGNSEGTITHRLAYRLFNDVVLGADMLLSMHGWGAGAAVVPYVEYSRDSPVSEASRSAARVFGLPYIEAWDWQPGQLTAVANQGGIPAIEPEVGGGDVTLPAGRALYRRGAKNLMRLMHILPGEPEVNGEPEDVTRQVVFSPRGGILFREVEVGQRVEAGQTLGRVVDLNGFPLVTIAAPCSGVAGSMRLRGAIEAGDPIGIMFIPRA